MTLIKNVYIIVSMDNNFTLLLMAFMVGQKKKFLHIFRQKKNLLKTHRSFFFSPFFKSFLLTKWDQNLSFHHIFLGNFF